MRAERDGLVKRVFPELRQRFRDRRVHVVDIDLRWGITQEQSERGETLPICLAEIERCRPYFIVLLGERYGWVLDELPAALLNDQPWLAAFSGRSVTELEIVHGILNDPTLASRAFFYFRDPRYIQTLPPEQQQDFVAESSESAAKLQRLKDRIRLSGLPLRENYPDPEALCAAAIEDLGRVIEREFPSAELGSAEEENELHEWYAESKRRLFSGRTSELAALDRILTRQPARVVVRGSAGVGKSALLAQWLLLRQLNHPEIEVVSAFVGASSRSMDWKEVLGFLISRLLRLPEIARASPRGGDDGLLSDFYEALVSAAAQSPKLLIVDGIDYFTDRYAAEALLWLPDKLPESVSIVLSVGSDFSLDALEQRGYKILDVAPLSTAERQQFAADYLASFGKSLSQQNLDQLIYHDCAGLPLFLRSVLESLRLRADFASLEARIDDHLSSRNLRELYGKILAGLEEDFENERPGLVRETLTLLWAARSGLAESELRDLLGEGTEPLPHARWSPVRIALEGSLVNRSGLLSFAHEPLRTAVHARYFQSNRQSDVLDVLSEYSKKLGRSSSSPEFYTRSYAEQERAVHRRLGEYFCPVHAASTFNLSLRALDEGLEQLVKGHAWPDLYERLRSRWFLGQAWKTSPTILAKVWREIETHSAYRIVDAFRESLEQPGSHPASDSCLANLLEATGHVEEATRFRYSAVQQAEDDPIAIAAGFAARGDEALRAGQPDFAVKCYLSARQEYDRFFREFGSLPGVDRSMIACLLRIVDIGLSGYPIDGIELLLAEAEQYCGLGPDWPKVQMAKARLALSNNDLEAARIQAEGCAEASRQQRDFATLQAALSLLAKIYGRTGQQAAVIRVLRERERLPK